MGRVMHVLYKSISLPLLYLKDDLPEACLKIAAFLDALVLPQVLLFSLASVVHYSCGP
jgi:hypothetical protein